MIPVLAGVVVASAFAPEGAAFPHRRMIGDTDVYSEAPLPDTMGGVLARSDALLRQGALYGAGYGRRSF